MQDRQENREMPLGFGMALAQDAEALERYAALSPAQQQSVLEGTHAVRSKGEMHEYVRRLGRGELL